MEIIEDERIASARQLYAACEENPGGHMVRHFVERIVGLIQDAGGTFTDIGTTAERLRQLHGGED